MSEAKTEVGKKTTKYAKLLAAKQKTVRAGIILFFSVALIAAGLVLLLSVNRVKGREYTRLLSTSSASTLEQKEAACIKAIALYPKRVDAYQKLLDVYADAGTFNASASATFLKYYNLHQTEFEKDKQTEALCFSAGIMYLSAYEGQDGIGSFADRVRKAYSFFEANHSNPNESQASEYLYDICRFYKNYILSPTAHEIPKEEMQNLANLSAQLVSAGKELDDYYKLTIYQAIVNLLFEQRAAFAATVPFDQITDVIDSISESTKDLSFTHQKLAEQKEILAASIEQTVTDIKAAYAIHEKGESK